MESLYRRLGPRWFVLLSGLIGQTTFAQSGEQTVLPTYFSPASQQVLRVTKLEAEAQVWLRLHQTTPRTASQQQDYAAVYQRIRDKLWVVQLQITATASALDNEEERAEQIAAFLRGQQDRRERRFTVAAIVVGGLTSIASGVILARDRGTGSLDLIGVGGGLAGVGLSLPSLFITKRVRFEHPHNSLAALWTDQNGMGLFPEVVWLFLHERSSGSTSLRDELVNQWQQYGAFENSQDIARYTGTGGRYTADELTSRAAMLDQTEAYVNRMQQALGELGTALEKP